MSPLKSEVASQCSGKTPVASRKQKHFKPRLNKPNEVKVIKKRWILGQKDEDNQPEQKLLGQRSYPAKALERVMLAKGLRLIVAASVALVASLLIHPNLAAIVIPISGALYAREIMMIWRERHGKTKSPEQQ